MSRFREYLIHLAQGLVIFSEIQALFLPRLYNKVSSSRCAPMYEKFRLLRQIGKYPIDFSPCFVKSKLYELQGHKVIAVM